MSEQSCITGLKSIASFLDVSPKTVGRWIKLHRFPIAKIGRTYVLDKELAMDWLLGKIPTHSRSEFDPDVDF